MALVLAGCQGPRPEETPAVASEPPPTVNPTPAPTATDRVRSVAEADGAVQLILPVRPDLHPGDSLHIRDGERLVAIALVTAADDQRTVARVVGPVPADVPPAPAAAVEAPHPMEPAPAAEPAAVADRPPEVPAESAHGPEAAAHPEPAAEEAPHMEAPAVEPAPPETIAVAAATPAVAAAAEPTPPALQPEVRARLEAERAYWELAARVLRLPAGGPELTALQQRLRSEITAQGSAP
jgi:hypothetical protein